MSIEVEAAEALIGLKNVSVDSNITPLHMRMILNEQAMSQFKDMSEFFTFSMKHKDALFTHNYGIKISGLRQLSQFIDWKVITNKNIHNYDVIAANPDLPWDYDIITMGLVGRYSNVGKYYKVIKFNWTIITCFCIHCPQEIFNKAHKYPWDWDVLTRYISMDYIQKTPMYWNVDIIEDIYKNRKI
jgi:hypothetical protein